MKKDFVEENVPQYLFQLMKILSAIADTNGGSITIPKLIYDNAQTRYFITMEEKDGQLTFHKHNGMSPEFKQYLGIKNN